MTNVKRGNGPRCSNRCHPHPRTVHDNLARAIVDALTAQTSWIDVLCAEVVRLVEQGGPDTNGRLAELRKREAELGRVCKRLTDAVERATDLENVLSRLRAREAERREVQLEIERLLERSKLKFAAPTAGDVRAVLNEIEDVLLDDFGREVGPLLRRLIDGNISAVPYRLFDRGTYHLRAHFKLNLLRLLPDQWQQLLEDRVKPEDFAALVEVHTTSMVVDLFNPPTRIRYAKTVYQLVSGGMTIAEASRRLGIPETSANRAYRTGKAMTELGFDDVYVNVDSLRERTGNRKSRSDRPDASDAA